MIRLLFMQVMVIFTLLSVSGITVATCSMNYDNTVSVSENNILSVSQNSNTQYLHDLAFDTWNCIAYYVDDTTGIPYDNSEMLDYTGIDKIGLYIASVAVAKEMGFISSEEGINRVNKTLNTLLSDEFETWDGSGTSYESPDIKIPYAWYNMTTLEGLPSNETDICTIDLGNYYACLIIGRNAFPELHESFSELLNDIDWSLLYDNDIKLYYGGFNTTTYNYSTWHCDYLGSDSQTASFLGIATESVPEEHWKILNRSFEERYNYKYYKPGWNDGIFTQFLPGIFIDQRQTLMGRSAKFFAEAQITHANNICAPVWGWSPSSSPCGYGYIGNGKLWDEIVTPHASVLAVIYHPEIVVQNLESLEEMGVRAPLNMNTPDDFNFGFRDSINWTGEEISGKYLTLDQAMIFLSIANYLNETTWHLFEKDDIFKNGIRLIKDYYVIYFAEGEDWLEQYGGGLDFKGNASNCSCLGNHWGNNSDYVKYSINMSEDTENLLFKMRYSDKFNDDNNANHIRIYLDEELKGELFTKDTYSWNEFLWSDQVDIGCISAGMHELNITSENGGQWNCVNLDCFKLIDDWKNEWTGKNSENGAIITTSELQDAIYHWLDDIPVRGHIMSTADLQEIIVIWLSH